jgi:tryptophan-rich sensory protein
MRRYAFQKSNRPGRRGRPSSPRGDVPDGKGSPWWALVGFVGLCLLVGVSAAAVNAPAMGGWYAGLVKPAGNPPNWVFAPVWTTLHVMIGTSAWLVWWKGPQGRRQNAALQLWGWQLLVNAAWSPAFFGLHSPMLGMGVIVPLLVLISLTIAAFARLYRPAALLLVPYLVWTSYATYLNAGFWWLNR